MYIILVLLVCGSSLLLSRMTSVLTRNFFNHSVDEWHESTAELVNQKDLLDKNDFETKKFPLLNKLTVKGFSTKAKFHQYLSDAFCLIFMSLGFALFYDRFTSIQICLYGAIVLLFASHVLTDFHEHLLMDEVSYILIWLGLLSHLFPTYSFVPSVTLAMAVWGAFVGYMSFYLFGKLFKVLRGIEGLGMGDAKLMAAFGAWLGAIPLVWVALLGACLAMVGVFAFKVYNKTTKTNIVTEDEKEEFPFGPALCVSFIVVMLLMLTNHLPSLL